MFNKVIVSDDFGSINIGVLSVLEILGIEEVQQVQYCDDAFLKIKNAISEGHPYELLITDLSFKTDHRTQKFSSGEALIQALKIEYPNLKIIVYSVEDRFQKVRMIVNNYKADAFVCKGRRGLIELKEAINATLENKLYLSPQVVSAISPKSNLEIEDYDIQLLKQLSLGLSQEEISNYFKRQNISPNSLSSVEKRLNKLRVQFKANNAIHLVSIAKDTGLV